MDVQCYLTQKFNQSYNLHIHNVIGGLNMLGAGIRVYQTL